MHRQFPRAPEESESARAGDKAPAELRCNELRYVDSDVVTELAGRELTGAELDEVTSTCSRVGGKLLGEVVDGVVNPTPTPTPTAVRTAGSEASSAGSLRAWDVGPTRASSSKGYDYEMSFSTQITSRSSSDSLNAPVGKVDWTPPTLEVGASITNLADGHNAPFEGVWVVAMWRTSLDDCGGIPLYEIWVGPDQVLCSLAVTSPYPDVHTSDFVDPDTGWVLIAPRGHAVRLR